MFALDLIKAIADRTQKIRVRGQDRTIRFKLNHRLRFMDGGELAGIIGLAHFLFSDVGCDLNNLINPPPRIEHRVVGSLNPYLAPTLGEAFILAGIKRSLRQPLPECCVFRFFRLRRIDEHPVVLALDLLKTITNCAKKIRVRGQDFAIRCEFNNGL